MNSVNMTIKHFLNRILLKYNLHRYVLQVFIISILYHAIISSYCNHKNFEKKNNTICYLIGRD